MSTRSKLFLAAAVGIIWGLLSARLFQSIGWGNIILWGIVGIALGFFTQNKKEMAWSGVIYGYMLFLSFLLSGFGGSADRLVGFIVFSLAFAIIGAGGGILATWIGSKLKKQ